ncbi:FBD-associated F-box protein At4g10400-like isoform X2 [Solanum dulcamara]|uniref:FBD-associated F-box protein At4g10400-like isoform X2 n=1 Tax=Solanum dulcamara TaxID=45834 RepID=UPI0024851E3F|nr:FBD-associated F-box protein At4g10400-like isoform X2 [Solanum dulcamara]
MLIINFPINFILLTTPIQSSILFLVPQNCRINNLPDEMLIAILSCLNFHEAARTSILSHRWRYLRKHTHCSLHFFNDKVYPMPLTERFISSINQVLKLHHSPSIHQFKVCFNCPIPYVREGEKHKINYAIDAWIDFAIGKQVKVFELDLLGRWPVRDDFNYTIPHVQKLLSISGGEVKLMTTLKTLKSLRFVSVEITQEVAKFILSNCPLLEQLCISASAYLGFLEATRSLPKLKSMEISHCKRLTGIRVRAPNLVSFTYIGNSIEKGPFKEVVPRLSELTIGGFYAYSFMMNAPMHSIYCSNLKRLKLEVSSKISSLCKVIPNEFHQLCHLKKLELDITTKFGDGLCFFVFLIKCSPHLSRLTIRVVRGYGDLNDVFEKGQAKAHAADRIVQEAMTFSHKCLKVVKLVGFIGSTSDYELASHLLRIAGSLKRMILCADYDYFMYNEFWPYSMWKKAIRKCAHQLKANLPPRAELLTYGHGFSKRIKLI